MIIRITFLNNNPFLNLFIISLRWCGASAVSPCVWAVSTAYSNEQANAIGHATAGTTCADTRK